MDKQNLYVALINAVAGVALSLLIKGNLLIYTLAFIALFTILLIERRRIYEKVFRGKFWWTVGGYAAVFFLMIGALTFVNRSNRDISLIIQATRDFVQHLKPGEYAKAYALLSDISKKSYPLEAFIKDNERSSVKIEDFRIDRVELNEFDKKKAVVRVSSPFLIYGQTSMSFESVKEDDGWRMVFTPSIIQQKTSQANSSSGSGSRTTTKRRSSGGGSLGSAFRSIF
jgi:hypothetical protein